MFTLNTAMIAFMLVAPLLGSTIRVGPDRYTCLVKEVRELTGDGVMAINTRKSFNATVGDTFSVNRNTGRVLGKGELKNGDAGSINVSDRGDEGAYFKLTWTYSRDVYVLYIREYEPGPDKPFLFAGAREIMSGTCR